MNSFETSIRSKRLQRIKLCARLLKWAMTVCALALFVLATVLVLSVLSPEIAFVSGHGTVTIEDTERVIADMSPAQRGALATLVLVMFTLLIGAVWTLRSLSLQFESMDFFSPKTLETVVSLGIWFISYAIFEVASDPVTSLILTLDYPEGEKIIDVTVDGGEIFCMILGALLLLFGWIMREAALLAEENRQII
ncbi:MAG: DUF2975 domain-containing protein [Roseibium sp.]|uniref:DUF2975 domain-containing protein n=1 Tax=Roseibium sp. TaxID=1936156 RepID=UPI0026069259|nr:DUF2975 domain-containing protein [Roseibium sp.]MCV0427673.1 DUF2975 domain-containing protein [Roseibium sp.]